MRSVVEFWVEIGEVGGRPRNGIEAQMARFGKPSLHENHVRRKMEKLGSGQEGG
jgi:hypothetical protein